MKKSLRFVLMIALSTLVPLDVYSHDHDHDHDHEESLQTIEFVIPSKPGGGWDNLARSSGQTLYDLGLLKNVVYTNMPGDASLKAQRYVLEANKPSRVLAHSSSVVVNQLKGRSPGYESFQPVAAVGGDYFAWFVSPKSPISDFKSLMELAKKRPIRVGGGVGRQSEILTASVFLGAGIPLSQIEYKVVRPKQMVKALAAGEIDVVAYGLSIGLPYLDRGEMNIIGHSSKSTIKGVDTKSLRDQGIDFEFVNYRLFMVSKDIDEEPLELLRDTLKEMYKSDDWKSVVSKNRWVYDFKSGDELKQILDKQALSMADSIKKLY
ncbi:tripartite tricarboxylate transporter substrate-binding protein [uncultured Pseudoteredinibacter sp.]|uniref:tripartite tricarboxylate transporter substrate-binding protein n=1 Tax=uncultured Pseudoteredinibacter sp. TaxID=1641701 RepID=UPI00262E7F11|nr:tripartite tricarboxylate transporter substrate-binding protein [uncultured Pseudoteredinibacter sp.]